jgi:putative heme-binding domain-containing protein
VTRPWTLAALLAISLTPEVWAQRAPFPIPDPDPEVERRSFIVADWFEVNLFAADPILAKPIQMNFDPKGRLWLVSSEVYPQIKPGQTANDKVIVLEDADGDGRAEKTTVFADGLLIPTGIEPGDGGAYVANSTELLHFKDTDGDGRADRKRVMLSGFGTEDTHHILHTLRWGFDGQLYFNQSIYIHSHIETPHGVRRLGGGGIWEFRPETMELEVFVRGLVNPWGHHFDRWGQSFATDGAGGEGINYCLPGAYYVTAPDAVRILPGLNPGSPKDCGLEVVSGRHLPEDWRGNLVTNDFRGNRVCRYVITEDGAGYASREQAELIKTKHVAFRPIDVKMGPDGAIYIADWYNPIIQHGEVDFRDPRRDHTRGRIWRVTARGRPLVDRPKLVGAETTELLDSLKAPEDWTRQQAKRVLKERGAAVLPALAAWVQGLDARGPDLEHQRLEALWTYQSLDIVNPELLEQLLSSKDARVRAAATRVVSHWLPRLSDPVGLLADRVRDEHPRVRLEAVRALAHVPSARAAEVAMRALDRPVDRFLDYALWLTARQLAPVWVPEVQAGRLDFGGNASHLVYALKAVGSPAVVKPLVEALRAGKIPRDQQEGALTLVATLGEPSDLGMVFDLAVGDGRFEPARRTALLEALIKAAERRGARPSGDLHRVDSLLGSSDDGVRAAAAKAVGVWRVDPLGPSLFAIAASGETSDLVRLAAINGLARLGGPEGRKAIEQLSGPGSPDRARPTALAALTALDPRVGAGRVVDWLGDAGHAASAEELVGQVVRLRDGPNVLANALAGKTIAADCATLALRAVRASGREASKLIDALTSAGHLSAGPRPLTADERTRLVADVARLGDPARGEAVFRRKDQQCLKCHAIAGSGGQVGPSLESVGASAPVDYLVDSILEPNKAIKENYHSTVAATSDGRVVSGIKIRQTDAELVLRDADDREVAIPLSAIEEQKPGGSLMPAGLADSMTRAELVDLIRFLSELGKIGPYSVGKARAIRRWQVLETIPDSLRRSHAAIDAALRGDPRLGWGPAYSLVSGVLPLDAIGSVTSSDDSAALGLVRGQVDVSTPGRVKLAFNASEGLSIWVDGSSVESGNEVVLDLRTGTHTILLGVDLKKRRDGIRCVLDDVPGSNARAQVVVGK